jgi:anaerobic selenocysteine-containing dehydrogenase/ferredoxin-NADP reductase
LSREEIAGFCTLCRSRCGTINTIENGRLTEVRNDSLHPTGKATCAKGRAAPEIAHSARRLKTPLKRTAPKGAAEPAFVEISWDEAFDTIAERLSTIKSESGPESVAFSMTSPSSSSVSDGHEWIWRFIRLFGSPNTVYSTEICNWHKDYAHVFTFGCATPTADYRNSDLIILWGHNPSNVWLAQAEAITAAKSRGARLVIVDPRRTAMSSMADLHLQVRPGTDGALAMGVSRELITRDLFHKDFVLKYTNAPLLVRHDNGKFLRVRDVENFADFDDYVVWDDVSGRLLPASSGVNLPSLECAHLREASPLAGGVPCSTAFELFKQSTADFDKASVAKICGIEPQQISALADMIGAAGSIAYHAWTGVGQHVNATQTERAIATLYALTDSFDKPGGNVRHASHPVVKLHDISMIPAPIRKKALGLEKRPLGPPAEGWITGSDFYDAVLDHRPYKIRGLFSFGANLLVSQPNPERGRQALDALEFHVHCNIFMNPTAELGDIILPVSVPWENEALRIGFEITHEAQEHIQYRASLLSRLGQSRSDTEIVFSLATRLGLGDEFFNGDIEAANSFLLKPLGLTLEELRKHPEGIRLPLGRNFQKYKSQGFATETRRAELYSERLLRNGYSPVPEFVPPPGVTEDFPIVMFSANSGYFCHSQHRGITTLRARRRDPSGSIHPLTARQNGIEDGDWMKVVTERGRFQIRAQVSDIVAPNILASDYGWWEPANDLGLSATGTQALAENTTYNQVISDERRDPISGSLPLRSTNCRIEKLSTARWSGSEPFVVVDKRQITPDTVSLKLVPKRKKALPAFLAGQSISVGVSGGQRSYSLTSPPESGRDAFTVAVKRVDKGQVSPAIVDDLSSGDEVQLGTPTGSFIIPGRNEFPIVMIAGGIGITPFMSYLRSSPSSFQGAPPRIVLLYYCRDPANTAFFQELDDLANGNPKLDIRLFLENESEIRFGPKAAQKGRFQPSHVDQSLIDARARFYICGVGEMIKFVERELVKSGVPKFEIFSERFISPVSSVSSSLSSREVTFARSKRTLTWTPEIGSLLALAEKSGLTLSSGCRVGQCESCATRILDGTVLHVSEVELTEDGTCLTCVSVPTSDVVLDA